MTSPLRSAVRVTVPYLLFGILWILLSDRILAALVTDPATVTALQSAKGVAFVLVTSLLLLLLVYREVRRREERGFRLQGLVEQSLAGVYLIQDGRFRYVNRKFAEIFGYEPEEMTSAVRVVDVIHPEDREWVVERMGPRLGGGLESVNHRFRGVRKDGEVIHVEAYGSGATWKGEAALIGLLVDHSERESLERRLQQSQKLEAIGRFTGAIAHDFNNLLTAIMTPVQLMLADLEEGSPLRPPLEGVGEAAARAASLSRQLLTFSRKQVVRVRPVNLNEVVEGMEEILRRLMGESVQVLTVLDSELATIRVDPTQMEQVVMNLVVNARDAMPSGGRLVIATANVDPEEHGLRAEDAEGPGTWVVLTVSDTGHGFEEDVRRQLFEPFFTTREQGTGLGLSTVFGIVSQAGGFIRVQSKPGSGSTFRVFLPATDQPARPLRPAGGAPRLTVSGTERILVVEDQDPIRAVILKALGRFGYQTLEAWDLESALRVGREAREPIDLLLTDVMLPGTSGPDLAREWRRLHPESRLMYVSGFADKEVFRRRHATEWVFLQKPFTVEELTAKVREALDAPPPSDPGEEPPTAG